MKLSVVLAVKNEEKNIKECLESVSKIANEIIVVDEYSTDETVKIAKKFGAKIYKFKPEKNFHENKQFGITKAKGDWILQLDADERITPQLADEIIKVINLPNEKLLKRKISDKDKRRIFVRHQKAIEKKDGKIGKNTGKIVGFFIPRVNYFLGKPLIHAGVYPDAVIRLIKNGKAYLPAVSVHEQMKLNGQVAWLEHSLLHFDSPTLTRYISRLDRYTTLQSKDFKVKRLSKNLLTIIQYSLIIPFIVFLKLFLRHKGYKDGLRGFLWSMFSASHWAIAYWKYWTLK